MGGEGTISQMISTYKRNRAMLKSIKPFGDAKDLYSGKYKQDGHFKGHQATEEEMALVRKAIKVMKVRERKKTIVAVILSVILFLVLLLVLLYAI